MSSPQPPPAAALPLFCPIPLVLHPAGVEEIDTAGVEWTINHGLIAPGSAMARSKTGLVAAAGVPFATTQAARVMCRYSYWAFAMDDHLDTLATDLPAAACLVAEANRVMYEPSTTPIPDLGSHPSALLTSLRDLRDQMIDCLGPDGLNMLRSANTHWLGGQLWKLAMWNRPTPPTVGEYLRMRWQKCGCETLAAFAAPGTGYPMSAAELYDPSVRAFTQALFLACTTINDLGSMTKEADTPEGAINICSALAAEHHLDPVSALYRAGELYERLVLLMTRLQAVLRNDPRPAVARYATELPQWLPATIHFSAASARYLTQLRPSSAPLPDLVVTDTPNWWDPGDTTPPPYPDIAWWWEHASTRTALYGSGNAGQPGSVQ
ncbi:terpene synthase family protein [Streptomyces wuyuanensis]|uniref:terpene synthase family protein n=1 Tax=Streptomyces wuyuanensis TaxID=1196353 RepID=UPI00342AAD54